MAGEHAPAAAAKDSSGIHKPLPTAESSVERESAAPPAALFANVLHLQRSYGNRAVRQLIAPRPARLARPATANLFGPLFVQRYEAYEHATEGDKAKGSQTATINGVDLTQGEINALADLYGSVDALKAADPTELINLRTLIRKQQANPGSVSEADWDRASGGRYNKLNLKNSSHFSPQNAALVPPQAGTPAGVDNRATFIKNHGEAIVWAARAWQAVNHPIGLPSPEEQKKFLNNATISSGFAEHFLMDAFSAGHLFNKDDVLNLIQTNLNALKKDQLAGVFMGVANNAWAKNSAFISKYQAKSYRVWWDLKNADRFKSLLEGIYDEPEGKDAVDSSIVKAAHDRLNTNDAGGGLIGVPVENDFGQWVLSGDTTLASSPDTQKWIDKALEQARANVQAVEANTTQDSSADLTKKVLAYFPRPTPDSTKLIASLIKAVTDPAGGMIGAIAQVINAEIQSLFDAIEAKGYVRKK
jgi:hypothetical protein